MSSSGTVRLTALPQQTADPSLLGIAVFQGTQATTHSILEDRIKQLECELEHSRQQSAALQQLQASGHAERLAGVQQLQRATLLLSTVSCKLDNLSTHSQQQEAQIQQLNRENASLKDTILTQAEQASQYQQLLHDQIQQEQAHSFSLSCQLQQATASQHQLQLSLSLLQSEQEGMVAAAQSLCTASEGCKAQVAALQGEVASLEGERDALAAMCSALTAQLSRACATPETRSTQTAAVAAAGEDGARDMATAEEGVEAEQMWQQPFEQVQLQPCSPTRSHELPLVSQSVWCSTRSASLSTSSCGSCGGGDELGEVDSVVA